MQTQSVSELRSKFTKSIMEEKRRCPYKIGWKVIHQMSVSGNIERWAEILESLDTRGTGRDKRRSIRARYLGLLKEDMAVTDPGREFYIAVLEGRLDDAKNVLNKQFEKWYFPVAEFQYTPTDYEKYTQLGYGLYPCFFILRILLYLGKRDKKIDPRFSLSGQEFLLFCLTGKNHWDFEERARLILDFRRDPSNYEELMNLIRPQKTYIERILQMVQLSSYMTVKDDRIILASPETALEKLLKFEYLIQTDNLITYAKDSEQYLSLLYDSQTFDTFHENVRNLNLTTDVILLNYIVDYIKSQGFTYDELTLKSFYASLKAKPFVILTGLSGTGKTKLCELFSETVCEDPNRQFLRIPVRPDWNDDRFMLGFFNPLTERYHYEPFLDFVMKALGDPTRPYIVCLDEMNLAHVEYYFSAFLSGLESLDKLIPLHNFPSSEEVENLKSKELEDFCNRLKIKASTTRQKRNKLKDILRGLPPRRLKIPSNLIFIGTVNIDETTYLFSPKVLDRANVIEFMKVDLAKKVRQEAIDLRRDEIFYNVFKQRFLSFPEENYKKWCDEHWREIVEERLAVINAILEKSYLHFGYRTRDEILRFIYCSQHLLNLQEALDFQIKQRILPKIKGPATIRNTLEELKEKLAEWGYSRSLEKLNEMIAKLEQGFTSYF